MAIDSANMQLVVVGSSAGGIEALRALVSTLPRDFPAPLVIAQHLDPRRPSHLAEILERRSTLPVKTILDHEKLVPGVIFVIPADRNVNISDGHLNLASSKQGTRPKPSINLLFSSAAEVYGEALVAVILTGSGSDGSAGALEVKRAGGTVVIQNPATATYPSMPQSLAPTAVDFIANIEEMGQLLHDLLTGASAVTQASETKLLRTFLTNVHEYSGLDFSTYKPATILRRLKRRMVATNSVSLDAYLRYLERQPDEYRRLISTFLIKVTEFFRDRELFDTLRRETLPRLIEDARRGSKELRIWSAGCATGEEAYSIAMLVAEALGDELNQFSVRIFATDLDAQAIAFARRGIYPRTALTPAPPELVERYFTQLDGDFEVQKRVRSLVVFGLHDLGRRAPFPHIDLVLCRNVLIYFASDLQRRVLQLFAYSLRNGGILVLGKAETTSPLPEFFSPVNSLLHIYRRHGEPLMLPKGPTNAPTLAQTARLTPDLTAHPNASTRFTPQANRARTSTERLGDAMLDLPIGIVIVDRHYDVQSINSAALRLLGIHRSAVGEDLLHLAEDAPQKPLRSIIDAALRNLDERETEAMLVVGASGDEQRTVQVRVYPQLPPHENAIIESAVLLINPVAARQPASTDANASEGHPARRTQEPSAEADQIAALQEQVRRLTASNRQNLNANEDLAQTNLDLRQSNEEFLVTTEELQAASEEVETLNEELQASNEELETLNEELQATVEELNTANDDLEARSHELQQLALSLEDQRAATETERMRLAAIIESIGDAVLVIDATGATVQTNPAYAQLFGAAEATFTPLDARGRPLALSHTPRQRTLHGYLGSMEFALPDGGGGLRTFEASGKALTKGDIVYGGVLVIRDVTMRNRLQYEFLARAAHELRTPLTSAQAALQLLIKREQNATSTDTADTARYLNIAFSQIKRLGTLVNDIVDVARLQNGKLNLRLAPTNLADVARVAVEALQLNTTQRIDLSIEDEPLIVLADTLRLEQVLSNLLTNAAKYAPAGDHIEVHVRSHDAYAEIAVQDFGPGMEQADVGHLFTRFYQGMRNDNAAHGGLGLGLYITREILLAHGGDVEIITAPGAGATFTIRLPLHSDETTTAHEEAGD